MNAARAHLLLAVLWMALVVPTILWWHDSVLWVSLASLWANACSHLAAWEAAKAKKAIENKKPKRSKKK